MAIGLLLKLGDFFDYTLRQARSCCVQAAMSRNATPPEARCGSYVIFQIATLASG